jgi:hypothetical protein
MVMDWREMAGRPTVQGWNREDRWDAYGGARGVVATSLTIRGSTTSNGPESIPFVGG